MVDKLIFYDGAKSIELAQYPNEAWTWLTGNPDDGEAGVKDYFKAVPWLYRGVQMRGDAVASMPFAVYRGETIVDESETWQNEIGFMPSPRRLLRLLEMSLCLTGKAYQYRVYKGRQLARLKYLNPESMQAKLDAKEGLLGFKRSIGSDQIWLKPEDVVYYWLEDPYTEIGPPTSCPAKAALMASGVLANVDEFVAGFFKRGAIKAQLLTVTGPVPPAERKRLEEWWNRVVAGIKNAFGSHVVNADQIKPVVVGEGLKELENQGLTAEKRTDIATALGVPQTKLFSSAATGLGSGGVVETDDKRFYADTIIPECEFIGDVLNQQVFEALGLRFAFQPEGLDVFKEDEHQRAESYAIYIRAGIKPSVAAEMLGLELPDGVDYADLDEWEFEKAERNAALFGNIGKPAGDDDTDDNRNPEDNFKSHLDKWERKALKRGPGKDVPFESEFIPADIVRLIRHRLIGTKTAEDIKAAFVRAARLIPDGADDPLPTIPDIIELTDADAAKALALWDELMPDYKGMLDAGAEGQTEYSDEPY